MRIGGELKVSDLAERHGIHRTTAYRWLAQLEQKYGSRVVGRRGRRGRGIMYTTEAAFASVTPLAPSLERENERLRELEERMADAETRADKTAAELSAVKRQMTQLAFRFG